MFRTRLLSGVVLIVIAFAAFWVGSPLLPILLFFVSLAGYRELIKALEVTPRESEKRFGGPEITGFIGIGVYYLLILLSDLGYMEDNILYEMACIIGVFLAELFVYVLAFPRYQAEQIACSVFAFLYAPVTLSFIDRIRMGENGKFAVWFILICSWGCDTCAYCVGKLIGKKKIFPVLRDRKSVV